MDMTIVERDDDVSQVALAGRLDAPAVEKIEKDFAAATSEKQRPAIVDMSGIEFMASRGIGMLFATSKNLKKAGHKLVLLNPLGMVDDVLRTSKMDKVMPIAYDVDDAIEIVHGRKAGAARRITSAAAAPAQDQPAVAAENVLQVAIQNELSELEGLNATLGEFLKAHNVPYRATYAVNLAIDELVVNVLRYAFVDDEPHTIDIELAIESEQVILRIVDDGRPFDPRRGPALDLHAEDRDVGGLGLILVLDLVDLLRYQRVDEKNRVEVRVHLVEEDEDNPPDENESAAETSELSEAGADAPEAVGG